MRLQSRLQSEVIGSFAQMKKSYLLVINPLKPRFETEDEVNSLLIAPLRSGKAILSGWGFLHPCIACVLPWHS